MPDGPATLFWPALVVLGVATVLGTPAFVTLGGAALVLFWSSGTSDRRHSRVALLAGDQPDRFPRCRCSRSPATSSPKARAPQRLVRVFDALFGRLRGGPAIVTVLVCTFFTSFTGASGVTILALGGLLMPILLGAQYSERDALGLVTGAGSLGMLLPPCLPLIVYGIVARIDIKQMFLGGLAAGGGDDAGHRLVGHPARAGRARGRTVTFDAREALAAAVGREVGTADACRGVRRPVQRHGDHGGGGRADGALCRCSSRPSCTATCSLFADMPRVLTECGLLIGGILLILGVALGFTNYLVDAEIPARAVDWTDERRPLAGSCSCCCSTCSCSSSAA